MARIILDARMYNESGVGRYVRNLISHLQELDKKNEYYILLLKQNYDTWKYHSNFKKVLADFRWYGITEQIRLPQILKGINADLVHFPHFNVPIFYQGKFLVTIHDLIHQHFQLRRATTHDPITYRLKKIGYRMVFRSAVQNSLKILTPSNFVKKQLVEQWRVDGNKIVVTPEAVDEQILAIAKKMSVGNSKRKLDKFKIKSPYIFYVGNAHPHKNVGGLIKAFLKLRKNYQNLKLVLSGSDNYFWQRIKKEYQEKDIVYTGFVEDEELVALYKSATCFVMPSFEEGFGIPLLEAMALSCPVVSSNAGSLKEVGGDAVTYFNPHDINDMVNKIQYMLNNVSLRKAFIEKGKKRAKQFSWKKLAQQTLEVYSEAIQ